MSEGVSECVGEWEKVHHFCVHEQPSICPIVCIVEVHISLANKLGPDVIKHRIEQLVGGYGRHIILLGTK